MTNSETNIKENALANIKLYNDGYINREEYLDNVQMIREENLRQQ